jgi:hypothetical protein
VESRLVWALGASALLTVFPLLPARGRWALAGLLAIVASFYGGYGIGVSDRPPSETLKNAAARARMEAMGG